MSAQQDTVFHGIFSCGLVRCTRYLIYCLGRAGEDGEFLIELLPARFMVITNFCWFLDCCTNLERLHDQIYERRKWKKPGGGGVTS